MRDLVSNIDVVTLFQPGALPGNSAPIQVGDFESLTFVVAAGAGSAFAASLEHSEDGVSFQSLDNISDFYPDPANMQIYGFPDFEPGTIAQVGYVGPARYVRLVISGEGAFAAFAIKGGLKKRPVPVVAA